MEYDILLIDDEEDLRAVFSEILSKADYRVSTAASGVDGLKLFDANVYQCVLLDLQMPGMDGTETLREIRKKDKGIPVYIITAFKDKFMNELKRISEDGLDFQILNKPIGGDQLFEVLSHIIKRKLPEVSPKVELRLYIANKNKQTEQAVNKLHDILAHELTAEYSLDVVNVLDDPMRADQDNIIATPSLVKISPRPARRVIGDFSVGTGIIHVLGLANL